MGAMGQDPVALFQSMVRGPDHHPRAALNPCPLCSARSADLAHLVGECASTTKYREEGSWASSSEVLKWCLEGAGDMADLRARVRLLGLSVSAAVAAMSSRTPTGQESDSV